MYSAISLVLLFLLVALCVHARIVEERERRSQIAFVNPSSSSSSSGPTTKLFTPTNYTIVDGFFHQSSPKFNRSTPYDLLHHSFGLVEQGRDRWSHFQTEIDRLNEEEKGNAVYKVFFVARHGQGWHNVAEAKYGSEAWNNYWSMEYGDGNITWGPDPELTPLGISQAQAVNRAWKREVQHAVPLPQVLFSSPLSRSMKTLEITWKDIVIEGGDQIRPVVVEHLREVIGVHTCDQRSRKSQLEPKFPSFDFEVPFSEYDQLWSPDFQESEKEQALRIQQWLNKIFATDSSQYVSITAHGGVINSFLRVVGHQKVSVPPGGFIPVVVKAVNDPNKTNELLGGGQSIPRPRRQGPEL